MRLRIKYSANGYDKDFAMAKLYGIKQVFGSEEKYNNDKKHKMKQRKKVFIVKHHISDINNI